MQDHWHEVRRLVREACDQEGPDRDALLARIPEGPVLDDVRAFLDCDAVHDTVPDTQGPAPPPVLPADAEDLTGSTLGPWKIVGRIGAGGMGVVYRAVRADAAFEREVALKVIGALGHSPRGIERFRLERETLARLDHPAIARLFDGGTTPGGSPYFVMELIDGVPIDRYCDAHRLSIGRRLEVFFGICRGVQYAHRNLVVHRDLKPDNILVMADGSPKLLDFGVAKLQAGAGSLTGHDAALAASTWALTPDFASPEQVSGGLVTTASDVYALGVLLHLLLTGLLPYRLGRNSRAGMADTLAAIRVVPPSSRTREGDGEARAALRRLTPRTLAHRLLGDLDAIILRALARDPAERYQTVEALLLDLERYRRVRPIMARPRTTLYVATRFFQRHHVGLTLGLALLLLVAAGVNAIVRQSALAREAQARGERRFADLRAMARVFMFDVDDAIEDVPGTTDARILIARTGLRYLERLAAEASHDPSLRRELAAGFVKVADALGNPSTPNVGDSSGARASYLRAIEIASGLTATSPDDREAARILATAHRGLGDVLAWMGDQTTALAHAEASAAQFAHLAALPQGSEDDRLQAAIGQIEIGDLLGNPDRPNLGRPDEARARYDAALAALRPLLAGGAGNQQVRRHLGLVRERIGAIDELGGRWPEAAASYGESFAIRQALAAAAPQHLDVQRDLAIAHEKLANIERRTGHRAEAVTHASAALAGFQRLADLDAADASAARSVAVSREHLADVLLDHRRHREALRQLQMALAGHRLLADRDAGNAQAPCDAARVSDRLGTLLGAGASTADACAAWRSAEQWRRRRPPGRCDTSGEPAALIAARLARCGGGH